MELQRWRWPGFSPARAGYVTSQSSATQAGDADDHLADTRREERLKDHTDIWLKQILPNYVPGTPPTWRMKRLWRQGLPPKVREFIWPVAIGNVLRITPELYEIHKMHAAEFRMQVEPEPTKTSNVLIFRSERSAACIPFDLPRTFPTLAFFREGGPLHDDCMRILEAYSCFRPDIGYVQGMTFLAAVLLLYLPPYPAFVALCNLLNAPSVLGLYRLEQRAVQCRAKVFGELCKVQLPAIAHIIDEAGLMPEMYLIEWFMTIYAKCLPIDVASVVWDLFLLDGEIVLYCTAIALLRISAEALLESDADLEACCRILGREMRRRVCVPDELLWHIQEVWRRTPPQVMAEIRGIAEDEFGTAQTTRLRPGVQAPFFGGGTLEGIGDVFAAWSQSMLSRFTS